MKRLLLTFALAVQLMYAADPAGLAARPEVDSAIKVLDAWITARVTNREQPGLSIGVVHDQHLIWSKGYGYADLDRKIPATPVTLYRIASVSKLFTATAVLQLRDAGKLHLDDPVAKHLSWFKIRSQYADSPAVTLVRLGLSRTRGDVSAVARTGSRVLSRNGMEVLEPSATAGEGGGGDGIG